MITQDWRIRARCGGVDPELFFPVARPGSALYAEQVGEAKLICGRCPVRAECLAFALEEIEDGVAGGLDAVERAALRSTVVPAAGGGAAA